jgi:MFS family permease
MGGFVEYRVGRSILAVVAGYVVFGASAALLFGLSGEDPHATPSTQFAALSVLYGVIFAAIGGLVAAVVSRVHPRRDSAILSGIIGGIALVSLAAQLGHGSVWSEVATVALMTPAVLIGGRLGERFGRR